jgi:hypothetical protein
MLRVHVTRAAAACAALLVLALSAPSAQALDSTPPPVVSCALGVLTLGNWPAACWHPYATTSPFNRRIPASPRLAANSAAVVSRLVGFGTPTNLVAGTGGTSNDWGHPTYYSGLLDPVFTLHCTQAWGVCPIEGMKVRVPNAARPAGGGDAHMTIVDQAAGWEYDLWAVSSKPSGGGTLSFGWGGRTRIDGDGLNSGGTGSKVGNLAGVIRAQEMAAGHIDHALFMVVNCDSGAFVYPAGKVGRACASRTNAPAMGTRFALNMTTAQIDALAVPAWKKTILRAMAEYGMYVGDTGGGAWGLQFESGTMYTSLGRVDPLVTFAVQNKVTPWQGTYVFDLKTGVDYAGRLRVLDPCTAAGTC